MSILIIHIRTENGRIRESVWKGMRWLRLRQHFWRCGNRPGRPGRCGRSGYRGAEKYLVQHPYQAQQTGYIQPYADCPLDGIQVGEDVYISIVNKADRYCWFMTPYLIITDEMTHALSLAAKRGVDVRIITPGIPDKKLIYSITRSFYHNLVQDGVRIYEWTPGFCHAKMSVRMTAWRLAARSIWITGAFIIILKMDVLWRTVMQYWTSDGIWSRLLSSAGK